MKRIMLFFLLVGSVDSFAGTMGPITMPENFPPFYLTFGSGYSWSETLHVNPLTTIWDPALEGYNSKVKSTELYTFGFGARITKAVSLGIEVTKRYKYEYRKKQTDLGTAASPQGNKSRNFDITNTTVMAKGLLFGEGISDALVHTFPNRSMLQPFIGGGVGVAYNEINNFHSVTQALSRVGYPGVSSIGNNKICRSFAGEFDAGLRLGFSNHFSFDIGYRYFNAGKIKGPDYLNVVHDQFATVVPLMVNSTLKAQEVFLNLNYTI